MTPSKINTLSDSELQSLLDNSFSFVDVLKYLGLNAYSGNHRTLKARIIKSGLSTEILEKNRKKYQKDHLENLVSKIRLSEHELLVDACDKSPRSLKRLILRNKLIDYKCGECGIVNSYNNKPINLQLDHINGNNKDNRIENLRWLCPNCHSQTETFSGRNSRKGSAS